MVRLVLAFASLAAVLVIALAATTRADTGDGAAEPMGDTVGDDCTFKGKKLAGKVKVVDSFADFEVEVVTSFPDLKVEKVDAFADDCGEWQFVDSFPDFTIELVDSFPDFTIEYVDAFPGVP